MGTTMSRIQTLDSRQESNRKPSHRSSFKVGNGNKDKDGHKNKWQIHLWVAIPSRPISGNTVHS